MRISSQTHCPTLKNMNTHTLTQNFGGWYVLAKDHAETACYCVLHILWLHFLCSCALHSSIKGGMLHYNLTPSAAHDLNTKQKCGPIWGQGQREHMATTARIVKVWSSKSISNTLVDTNSGKTRKPSTHTVQHINLFNKLAVQIV